MKKDTGLTFSTVLAKAAQQFPLVASDPAILAGSYCIVGTRIPVYGVLEQLQIRGSVKGVQRMFPHLTTVQIGQAIRFAAAVLEQSL